MERQRRGEDFSLLVDDLRRREPAGALAAASHRGRHPARRYWVVALLGWCVLAVLAHVTLRSEPLVAADVRSDLIQLLEKSRAAVESGRSRDGRLPVVLPDPACARLVAYTVNGAGDAYVLRAGLAGRTLVWNSLVPDRFEEFHW
ncbi:MAG: hypothetical protein KDH20_11150 [Rhodocyclaceae bacterium]|nr:hypothetical protein [Rhodocyclaceae bacterium]